MMYGKVFWFVFMVLFFGVGSLYGQDIHLSPEDKKIMNERFWGNEDLLIGVKLKRIGRLEEAFERFRKSIITFEKEKNWEAYIRTSSVLGYNYIGRADYQTGITVVRNCLSKIEKEAPEFVRFSLRVYGSESSLYSAAEEFELAITSSRELLSRLRSFYDADTNLDFVMAFNDIGNHFVALENFDSAYHYYLKALNTLDNLEEINQQDWHQTASLKRWRADTHVNIGNLYQLKDNNNLAIKHIKLAIENAIIRYGEDSYKLMDFYYKLGYFYLALDEYEQSTDYYKKAIFIAEQDQKANGSNLSSDLFYAYLDLAFNYLCLQKLDESIFFYEKCLEINLPNQNSFYESYTVLQNLAQAHLNKKEFEIVASYLTQIDNLIEKNENGEIEENDPYFMDYVSIYGDYWSSLGDRQKARSYLLEHLQLLEKKGFSLGNSDIFIRLSESYFQDGLIDSALLCSQQCMAHIFKKPKSFDSTTLPKLEELTDGLEIYKILDQRINLLGFYAENTIDKKAKEKSFQEALILNDLTDKVHLNNFKRMTLLRGGQSESLIKASAPNYLTGLNVLHDYYQFKPSEELLEKEFAIAQKMKSQKLWLTLLKSEAASLGSIDETLLDKERDLLSDINFYEKKLLEAQNDRDTVLINRIENEQLFPKRTAYANLQQTLETEHPEYFESKYKLVTENSQGLQTLLNEEELFIEYVIGIEDIFIFTLAKNEALQVQSIPIDSALSEQVSTYNNMLKNSPMFRKSSREKFIKLSYELYQQFLKPIESQLVGKDRLIIVGDKLTNYIPFETILNSKEIKPFSELDYLLKTHKISYHYSAALFAKARRKKTVEKEGVFAFAPVYEEEQEASLAMRSVDNLKIDSTLRAYNSDGSFSPLPESESEVKSIIDLFNENGNSNNNLLSLREEATENALKTNLEKDYQFIHIAGHSFADLENPKFSGIACFEEENEDLTVTEDGTLFAGEIYNISSQADLITLSSCESGFGKLDNTEGFLGLNRAFIYAGTPNVVFSLWKIYDKVSAKVMVDFYKNVLEGEDYSASLRLAKLNLLNKEETAAPHYWSPFLLIGQ